MPAIKVTCSACNGTGKQPLGVEYIEVLDVLKKHRGSTSNEVLDHLHQLGIKGLDYSAVHMRLCRLYKLGMVNRLRSGKSFMWSINPHKS